MARPAARIVSPDMKGLAALVQEHGWEAQFEGANVALVYDLHPADVGDAAHTRGLALHELSPAGTSLEALFLELTRTQS